MLDTSALTSFMDGEPGADIVERILRSQNTIYLPWPVLHEVYYTTSRKKGEKEADKRYALIKQLPVTIVWTVDEASVLTAARYKSKYRLSFADSLIAAIAFQKKAILVHKDPEFESMGDQVRMEALPYK